MPSGRPCPEVDHSNDRNDALNLLDRFEHTFERAVEGSIGRVFRSQVQPAEIGRKLERAMAANQLIGVGSVLVPNEYQVTLNPKDLEPFAGYLPGLCRQMETWLQNTADDRGFSTIDRIRVQIGAAEATARRAVDVSAKTVDRPPALAPVPAPVQATEVFHVVRKQNTPAMLLLKFEGGAHGGLEFVIRKQSVTVGRALENDLVLDSADVSRRHARLDFNGVSLTLTDLGSTNGTKVNGRVVRSRPVAVGDEISFGASRAVVASTLD